MLDKTTKKPIFKISLLSISLLLMLAPVIAPAIPLMGEAFTGQSKSSVELLLTVPNFGIIAALFMSPLAIKGIGKKATILLGMSLALTSGVVPIFFSNYYLILLLRFMFGFGIGLFNSLAVSLLAEFYEGEELATMMGLQSMVGALGSAILSFAVGYFILSGWQATFSIYFIIVPVMILFMLFVPIQREEKVQVQEEIIDGQSKQTLNAGVLSIAALIFFLFTFYMVIPIKMPEFVLTKGIGTMSSISIVTGLSTLIGIPVGIFYGKIHKYLQDNVLTIGLLVIPLGLAVVTFSGHLLVLTLGVMISGIGFGLTMPYLYTKLAQVAPKNSVNLAYTTVLIATNIGVFASPLILNTLTKLFKLESSQGALLVSSIGFILLLIIVELVLMNGKKQQITKELERQ